MNQMKREHCKHKNMSGHVEPIGETPYIFSRIKYHNDQYQLNQMRKEHCGYQNLLKHVTDTSHMGNKLQILPIGKLK